MLLRRSSSLSYKTSKRVAFSTHKSTRLPNDNLKLSDFILKTSRNSNDINSKLSVKSNGLSFHIETYGCQMNISDSEIVRSILTSNGYSYTEDIQSADVILTNTCAIRENAENKIWQRLGYYQFLRKQNKLKMKKSNYPLIGVLGCMAERLKTRLLEKESVDFVCGPDAYRDIPRLLHVVSSTDQKEANTQLSIEETYADISPVRESSNSFHAFVSIMRGCNNMCSFCIVPYTRGRERSRDLHSILLEIKELADKGIKEIVLLGQNVNGYHDTSSASQVKYPSSTYQTSTVGFTNLYNSKKRDLPGARFVDLLSEISDSFPEIRIRFTSPHPKDFPLEVLHLIQNRSNICKSIHLPLQSGSTEVLQRMRRGYSAESYIELVDGIRSVIPGVNLSTDIITGFCGETEENHLETLKVMNRVQYDQAFMFAYSLRDKTYASYHYEDDVSEATKSIRLTEIIATFRKNIIAKNVQEETGRIRLILVEGFSTKSNETQPMLTGRTDGNKRVLFPAAQILNVTTARQIELLSSEGSMNATSSGEKLFAHVASTTEVSQLDVNQLCAFGIREENTTVSTSDAKEWIGKYILVRILNAEGTNLKAVALFPSSITDFDSIRKSIEHLE